MCFFCNCLNIFAQIAEAKMPTDVSKSSKMRNPLIYTILTIIHPSVYVYILNGPDALHFWYENSKKKELYISSRCEIAWEWLWASYHIIAWQIHIPNKPLWRMELSLMKTNYEHVVGRSFCSESKHEKWTWCQRIFARMKICSVQATAETTEQKMDDHAIGGREREREGEHKT